jgi:predicted N-formylglutamate amidohydrolase
VVARRERVASKRVIPTDVIVTCEHGGNDVPRRYRPLFAGSQRTLDSHRGYDPGAIELARELASACNATLVSAMTSRLLVELNRSAHHVQLFSEFTRDLPREAKETIITRYYLPYRTRVEQHVGAAIAAGGRVVHLSSHTFTPVLDGVVRNADVGLLYDPRRWLERDFCERWGGLLAQRIAPLRVRRNYPYRGYDDGLTTALRRRFPSGRYLGVEIEVNQKHALNAGEGWRRLRRDIVQSALDMLAATAVASSSRSEQVMERCA